MNKVHFVEMSVSASGGQDQIQDELKAFADQLKPYVPWFHTTLTLRKFYVTIFLLCFL